MAAAPVALAWMACRSRKACRLLATAFPGARKAAWYRCPIDPGWAMAAPSTQSHSNVLLLYPRDPWPPSGDPGDLVVVDPPRFLVPSLAAHSCGFRHS